MSKIRLDHERGRRIANSVMHALEAGTTRIALAGSLRRGKALVGDLEILAIPGRGENLLGEPGESALDPILGRLLEQGRLTRGRCNGARYKQFGVVEIRGLMLDLFLTTPECWGVLWAIRTGPEDFSKALVTCRSKEGLLPEGHIVHGGRVLKAADTVALTFASEGGAAHSKGQWETLDTPEEDDFLRLCGGWVPPELRSAMAVPFMRQGRLPALLAQAKSSRPG